MPRSKLYYFNSNPHHQMNEKEFKEVANVRISVAFKQYLYTQKLRELINGASEMLLEMHPSRAAEWRGMFSHQYGVHTTAAANHLTKGMSKDAKLETIFKELAETKAPISKWLKAISWAEGTVAKMIIKNLDEIAQQLINDLDEHKLSAEMLHALFVCNEARCSDVLGKGPASELRTEDVEMDKAAAPTAARPRDSDIVDEE